MASRTDATADAHIPLTLAERYKRVRALSLSLCETLAPEDFVVQSMPDVSPTKWHLAHITWFFERFVLVANNPAYKPFNESFDFLFNSYYHTAGSMHARPRRGLLSRPTVSEVYAYRAAVDEAVLAMIEQRNGDPAFEFLITLGLNHEQQHQELLLTDIKHVLSINPMQPVMNPNLEAPETRAATPMSFIELNGGIQSMGARPDSSFCFDNETPQHCVLLEPFALGSRLVSNGDYKAFMEDGAYQQPALWLADGWTKILEGSLSRPLYWSEDLQSEFTLAGPRNIDPTAPVCHISYYEADAYARWAGARLPSEYEWELAANDVAVGGNLLDAGYWQPKAGANSGIDQLYGDVWEWTSSAYAPYPGFTPLEGSLGEYNGKFMVSQQVVRGGSCVTSADHIRASYRSFFYPDARWQFLGLRLAKNI